jgi:hypothetical protein
MVSVVLRVLFYLAASFLSVGIYAALITSGHIVIATGLAIVTCIIAHISFHKGIKNV